MQLTPEQLAQVRAALIVARSGIRQLTIASSDVRSLEASKTGRVVSDDEIARYVTFVGAPFVEPIERALAVLEASR